MPDCDVVIFHLIIVEFLDEIFATRQLHTTRLWKPTYDETHQVLTLTKLQEYYNSEKTVRFVQLNPDISGEFCELRRKQIIISRDGYSFHLKHHD